MTMTSVHALREAQPNVTLVQRLVAAGLISEHQLRRAMQERKRSERPLGEILVEFGMISEKVLNETLAQLLGSDAIDLHTLLPDTQALAMVPREAAEQYCVLPVEFDERGRLVTLAVTETLDLAGVDAISRMIDSDIEIATVAATRADIRGAIARLYDVALTIPDILREIDNDTADVLQADCDGVACDHPLNRLLDAIITEAVRRDAAAIHFEPEYGFVRVRFRVDGLLSQVMALHPSHWPGLAARLAAMFGLSEGTRDLCSDGSVAVSLGSRRKRLHASRRATLQGDDFVVGIVAADREAMSLDELGLDNAALQRLQMMMARPHGMIVVAGPPGCGRTTTLYSMLNYRCDESVSIVTLEERPSCAMPAIRQAEKPQRQECEEQDHIEALMRQDFDVLMMDELRDDQDVSIALQAASRGRQVYATVPAKSALHALSRLDEFGLQRSQIASNVVGFIGQRLLRKLCVHCRQAYTPQPYERKLMRSDDSEVLRFYREGGCEHCHYSGYAGRVGIFEVVQVDETIDEQLACGATVPEMRRAISAAGIGDLADAALRQVLAGVTSLAEASRVVDFAARLE